MIQRRYHIRDFSNGKFERILRETADSKEYREAAQVFLWMLEHNWDSGEIERKIRLIKEVLPKAEISGITHYDESAETADAGDFDSNAGLDEIQNQTVLSFCFFEKPSFTIVKINMPGEEGKLSDSETGSRLGEIFSEARELKAAMISVSGFMKNVDLIIETACKGLKDIPIFGACGLLQHVEGNRPLNYVFDETGCYDDAIIAVLFSGEHLHVRVSYNYGWTPVGKKMRITKTDGDFIIKEIDYEPAVKIYEKYLGLRTPDMIQVLNICEFPLITCQNELIKARIPIYSSDDGALHFGAPIDEGSEIQFSYGAQKKIFQQIFDDGKAFCDFSPEGMFLIICMNRVNFLKEHESFEIDCYRSISPELVYLHGNSEIFYLNGAGGELNSALVAVGIREGDAGEKKIIEVPTELQRNKLREKKGQIPLSFRVMQFMQAVTDDLEKLAEKANVASQAKSTFLSNMSHEIRTPINAVLGMDEMILRESREQMTLEYAGNIKAAGHTLLNLINDVLDFSKIEAGKLEIIPAEYDLASTLHDLVTLISVRAKDKDLFVETNVAKDIPSVLYGDEIRLKQVITNILTNAVKYTNEGGITITVSGKREDDEHVRLFVSVKDTGIGIKKEDLHKLFLAFERIEEERNRRVEGTGLGMNITTRLLEMMGSKLEVSSVYGEGSLFSFSLVQKVMDWKPIGDYEASWRESKQAEERYEALFIAPEAKILTVDDMPMNLMVFEGLLKKTRVQITTASSGAECLELVTKEKYDIIFLDHRMPEMDGIETRKRMEELAGNLNGSTPVIALTANASAGAREEYLSFGFTDYLSKPINALQLEKMIAHYIPEEKMEEAFLEDMTGADSREESLSSSELPIIDGVDWEYALLHLPDRELLLKAVTDFYNCIELHADRLEEMKKRLLEDKAFSDYRIQVHGMKSSAATVGIIPLAGMAKELENAAAAEEEETIRLLHMPFIRAWRRYKERLNEALQLEKAEECAEDIDTDVVKGYLEMIRIAMEDYDIDTADSAVDKLSAYAFPEEIKKEMQKLRGAVSDVDAEGSLESISVIMRCLEEQS